MEVDKLPHQCTLVDGTHRIGNGPIFKNMDVNNRYQAARKQRLCYGCLGQTHAIRYCKVNASGINGSFKNQNQPLHSENPLNEGNHAVNVSAATINQSSKNTSFLQMAPVSIQTRRNRLKTYAFLDSASTLSFIDQNVQKEVESQI